jgi:hypothetical protein
MKTTDFITKYRPCEEGTNFAAQFETMQEVWEKCKRTQ